MNNPLGVSPSKGNQVTTRGKEKIFDLGGNRTHDLRIRSTVTTVHMYPYFLFAAIHHLIVPDFLCPTS